MTILVQQLRERALKATPGPWQHERLGIIQGGPMQTYVNGEAMPQLFTSHGADFMEAGEYLANADFVAAANPAAVLALLDEIDRLQDALQEERQLRAKVGRIAHYLNEFANKRTTFSRIQEINDAIQEVPDGH